MHAGEKNYCCSLSDHTIDFQSNKSLFATSQNKLLRRFVPEAEGTSWQTAIPTAWGGYP